MGRDSQIATDLPYPCLPPEVGPHKHILSEQGGKKGISLPDLVHGNAVVISEKA